jgi:hypothetical protein
VLDAPNLKEAARAFRQSGEHIAQIIRIIAECGDPALQQSCQLADRRAELFDESSDASAEAFRKMWLCRRELSLECKLTKDAAMTLFKKIAESAGQLVESERLAAGHLATV